MAQLPVLSGKEIIAVLEELGYYEKRRESSHIRLCCEGRSSVTVPDYSAISRGLLRKILRDAKLSPERFLELL